ncbi:MAG: FHA domain-containing protein [Chloroflexi bacterium]|nr:FHA domain-containing protein [Chloroflexota bacterium]MBU1746374.1 FHA domain-containing protein [Chloroflexota bacterium]
MLVGVGTPGTQVIPLTPPGPLVIGQDASCQIQIDPSWPGAESVAPRHAVLYWEDGVGWLLRDLRSPSGMWIDGLRSGHHRLRPGKLIGLGRVQFRFLGQP